MESVVSVQLSTAKESSIYKYSRKTSLNYWYPWLISWHHLKKKVLYINIQEKQFKLLVFVVDVMVSSKKEIIMSIPFFLFIYIIL